MGMLDVSDSELEAIDGAPEEEAAPAEAPEPTPEGEKPGLSRRQRAQFVTEASQKFPEFEKKVAKLDSLEAELRAEREERIRMQGMFEEMRRQTDARTAERQSGDKASEYDKKLADIDARLKKAYAGESIDDVIAVIAERQTLVAKQESETLRAEWAKQQDAARANELPPVYQAVRMRYLDVDSHQGGPALVRTLFESMPGQPGPEKFERAMQTARTILGTRASAPRANQDTYSQPSASNASESSTKGDSMLSKLPERLRATAREMVARGMMDSEEEYAKLYFEGRKA